MPTNGILLMRFVGDLTILLIAFLPTILFELHIFAPYHRGFFCGDETLSHPYKDSTISSALAVAIGLGLNIIVIMVIEILLCQKKISPNHYLGSAVPVFKFGRFAIYRQVVNIYKMIGFLLFGCAVQQSVTDITKFSIGRLRPHFFDVCRVNMTAVDCSLNKYIVDFTCTSSNEYKLRDMRLSFPSGHASFAVYSMTFLMLYLQVRFVWKVTPLLRPFFQVIALWLALVTCVSRVSDYKHHATDVLAGAAIGATCAILMLLYVTDMFRSVNVDLILTDRDDGDSIDRRPSTVTTVIEIPLRKVTRQLNLA